MAQVNDGSHEKSKPSSNMPQIWRYSTILNLPEKQKALKVLGQILSNLNHLQNDTDWQHVNNSKNKTNPLFYIGLWVLKILESYVLVQGNPFWINYHQTKYSLRLLNKSFGSNAGIISRLLCMLNEIQGVPW